MTSPVLYTQLSLALMSLMICVIFFLAWVSLGKRPHALDWSVAFLASSIYWVVIMLPDMFPNFEAYWLTANVFGFTLLTLCLHGHCQRTNTQLLPGNLWPYATLAYAVVVWTTIVKPHGGVSISILPFASAITLFLSVLVIVRHRPRPRPAEWAAAISMAVFAVAQTSAAIHLLQHGSDLATASTKLYEHPWFMAMPAGFMGITMFVIFMLASDISGEMKEIAVRDQLTGLLNRRGFGEQSVKAYATARRTGRSISVIMADLDHFKDVNDQHGHAAGDAALEHFAQLLMHERRAEDIVARIGGEEFALVLPGTELEKCIAIADELCERLAATPLVVDGRSVDMTSSFGVATISDRDTCLTDAIVRADRALYRSKRAGRNRVDLESSQLMRTADGKLRSVSR
jgi:diguanylate cyclase (GGDEF)-like protein